MSEYIVLSYKGEIARWAHNQLDLYNPHFLRELLVKVWNDDLHNSRVMAVGHRSGSHYITGHISNFELVTTPEAQHEMRNKLTFMVLKDMEPESLNILHPVWLEYEVLEHGVLV